MKTKNELIEYHFSARNLNEVSILDIGSGDGAFVNSLSLINKGCYAYLVEPSPKLFEKLHYRHELNDKVKCFPFAITENNGTINIHEKDADYTEEENTETIVKFKKLNSVSVIGMDFYTFLITADQVRFNFININASGNEYEILKQINLDSVECEMLAIDYNGKYKDMYISYISTFTYRLLLDDGKTLIFKK